MASRDSKTSSNARFKITGHRFRKRDVQLTPEFQARFRKGPIKEFAEVLGNIVGDFARDRIMSGRWYRSKNKRYNYYRTWVQYRYGSDRARKALGGVRMDNPYSRRGPGKKRVEVKYSYTDQAFAQMSETLSDPIAYHRFLFLARVIDKHSREKTVHKRNRQGTRRVTELRTRHHRDRNTVVWKDITKAVDQMTEILDAYRYLRATGTKEEARARLSELARGFFVAENEYTRLLKETQVGQRLMRYAERAAVRHMRNVTLLDAESPGHQDRFGYADDMAASYNPLMSEKRRETLKQRYRELIESGEIRRGKIPVLTGGHFPYGYQTGQLARAWGSVNTVTLSNTDRKRSIRIKVRPNTDDMIETKRGPRSLTRILKRNILKQGGNPDLLTPKEVRSAIREALDTVQDVWASLHGVKLR